MSRSWATRPQMTEQVRDTSDRTPAPKLRNACSWSPPTSTTTGMRTRTTAVANPYTDRPGLGSVLLLERGFMGATPSSFGKAVPLPNSKWLHTDGYEV